MLHDLLPDENDWITEFDRERLIDDFVFLMILLGDDFLPELPSLDINEGSIQMVVNLYKYVIAIIIIIIIIIIVVVVVDDDDDDNFVDCSCDECSSSHAYSFCFIYQ